MLKLSDPVELQSGCNPRRATLDSSTALSVGRGEGLGVGTGVGRGVGSGVGLLVGRGVGLIVGKGVGLAVGIAAVSYTHLTLPTKA